MRFDTAAVFQTLGEQYNPDTGNTETKMIAEEMRRCSVTNTGTETMRLIYGEIVQNSLTIRLRTPVTAPFSRVKIGDKFYSKEFRRDLRNLQTFVITEIQ